MLSTRMRNASTSPSSFAPSADSVPVRRASQPSTKSSASATDASVTRVATATSRSNEAAVRAATPTASVARISVTQPAGPSLADGSRRKRTRERHVQRQPTGETDEPAGTTKPDRPRKHIQEQEHADETGHWAELVAAIGQHAPARPQPCSAREHPEGTTVPGMRRFVERP